MLDALLATALLVDSGQVAQVAWVKEVRRQELGVRDTLGEGRSSGEFGIRNSEFGIWSTLREEIGRAHL